MPILCQRNFKPTYLEQHLYKRRKSVAIREICVRIMFSCPFLCAFKKNMYICRGKTKH